MKARCGRNAVQIEYDGDAAFVEGLPFVESVTRYPRWLEAVAPSLHKIFTSLVGEGTADQEGDHE